MREFDSIFSKLINRTASVLTSLVKEISFVTKLERFSSFYTEVIVSALFITKIEKTLILPEIVITTPCLLMETGEFLLLEDGFKIILE